MHANVSREDSYVGLKGLLSTTGFSLNFGVDTTFMGIVKLSFIY